MDYIAIVGIIASLLVTIAYIPEVVQTVRTKKTRDISLLWIATLEASQILYLIYGVFTYTVPIMISSTSGTVTCTILLAYKLKYKNR